MDLVTQNAKVVEWPEKLQCLFWPQINGMPVRYRVLYGGRGGAKSWGIARALVIKAAQQPLRVLCARELQNSVRDSVHRVLCDQIDALGLTSFYRIEQNRIFCPATGSIRFPELIRVPGSAKTRAELGGLVGAHQVLISGDL